MKSNCEIPSDNLSVEELTDRYQQLVQEEMSARLKSKTLSDCSGVDYFQRWTRPMKLLSYNLKGLEQNEIG
jgi:hypothetical protein